MTKIYAAYGSNLNHEQMARRCPKAKFIGIGVLKNYRMVFRRVADIEYAHDSCVQIGLWRVTDDCIKALDSYEGYPSLYGKGNCSVYLGKGKSTKAFIYFMNSGEYEPPSDGYYQSIAQGYLDCGINLRSLENANRQSEDLWFEKVYGKELDLQS
jgi:gamma-glutamylcyclotransferase (GGCT)/AIG2-like uncharacterized protein YtfP